MLCLNRAVRPPSKLLRLLGIIALLLVAIGPATPPAAADAPLRITDQVTVQARHVPSRVSVGEPIVVELIFHNTGDRDFVAAISQPTSTLIYLADFRFDWGLPCNPATDEPRGVGLTEDPGLGILHGATTCAFAAVLISGTVPAKSQVSAKIAAGSISAPTTIVFSLNAASMAGQTQRSEIRVVAS